MSVTALRKPPVTPELEALRALLAARARTPEGRTGCSDPGVCIYRFTDATPFTKAVSFGVTLGLVAQGAKRVRVDGVELLVDGSNMLVITREVEHTSVAFDASSERPYLGVSLCFTPEQVARALLKVSEAGAPPAAEKVPAFLLPYDARVAGGIVRYLETIDDPLDRKLIAPLIAEELLVRLLRTDAAAAVRSGVARQPDAPRILDAMNFIRANLARPLTVQRIAREVAMSPSHFAHRFTAVARTTPMRYLREARLDVARTLLVGNTARVSEVAARVGFESPSHFNREFKRRYGSAPGEYVRQLGRSSAW
ncbi:MAG: AraC family transcriptional regulator [Myxococcaceae bacterium]|nr:AraC family transcriptional regulator [Myxococcaceae bacterium]